MSDGGVGGDGGDGGDGGVEGDSGGDALATVAAVVCVGGGRLTEADCHSRLAEISDGERR